MNARPTIRFPSVLAAGPRGALRRVSPICWLAVLSGCGIGLTDLDDTGTPDTDDGPVQIAWIDPDWGPTAGGSVITLTGEGFEGQLTVYFDDVSASTFRNSATELLVTTPPWSSEGPVDVRVVSGLGEDTLPGGFTYSDDGPPPDTGDTGTTGDVGGLVEFSLLQIACPQCLGMGTTDLQVSATAAFHPPVSGSWIGWMPAMGSCAVNPSSVPLSTQNEDVGSRIYLESGGTSHALDRTTSSSGLGTIYIRDGLDESDYLRNASWELNGPFHVTSALRTTEGFSSIQPIQILQTWAGQPWSAAIHQSGQTFTWQGSAIAGRFVIDLVILTSNGSATLGEVMCVGPDNGAMQIPSTYLSTYPLGSLVVVTLYRYQVTRAGLLPDGSTVEGVSWFGVMGTGKLAP